MKAEQLRKSILQLAIQGKLVPQDPNDEPASVLLERIRAEKQKLSKQGKIKKDKVDSIIFKGDDNCYYEKVGKSAPICIDEELGDIDLPTSWLICRLSAVANIYTGNSINETEKQKKFTGLLCGYNYIGTKDVNFDHSINYENGIKIPFDNVDFRIAHKYTPLLCIEGGSAGRKIGILTEDVCFGNKLCAFESFGVNPKYIYYYLQNPTFTQVFKEKTTGIIGGVSVNTLKSLFFFLPPLAEQARIVAEIERFEPLLAEYDKLEQQVTKLDGEIYDKVKKSILQYAIQGKLVEQDPNDEPASVLLERIRTEKKVQLDKKYVESYIYKGDDNCYYEHIGEKYINISEDIPFDLPNGWEWSRLNSIINVVSARRVHQSDWKDHGIPFYRAREIAKLANFGKVENELYISQELFDAYKLSGIPLPGDLMVTAVGTIGKTYIVKLDDNFYYKDASVICFENRYNCNSQWLKSLMDSPYMIEQIKSASAGTTVDTITIEKANNYLIPIPPLAEQKRIVDKINEIFAKL